MREQLNCPNCGAPITSEKCEYCGTLFYDFSTIDVDKPCYLKIKYQNAIVMVKAKVRHSELNMTTESQTAYDAFGSPLITFLSSQSLDLSLEFECVPFDNDVLAQITTYDNERK